MAKEYLLYAKNTDFIVKNNGFFIAKTPL